MTIAGRNTRFFRFFMVAIVALFFLLAATNHGIFRTVKIDEFQTERTLFDQIKDKFVGENNWSNIAENDQPEIDILENEADVYDQTDDQTEEPFDDTMPGAYLKLFDPAPINQSYCKYNYELPYDLIYNSTTYLFPPQLGKESQYRIIYNVTEAHAIENVSQVTYATHMTANFAYFIPELLKEWDGLITVAAFVPDLDVAFFLEQVNQYCYCEPEMHRVSIHIVTHKLLPFSKKDVYFDRPKNCFLQDSSKIRILKEFDDTITYPVNVLRNVARTSALSEYVLLSDVELIPSKGLASGFLKMINTYNKTSPKEVFVVPIFEVEETESIPENKRELISLLHDKRAVHFHGMVCEHCQKFPGLDKWMESGYSKDIKPLITVKRHKPYDRWEPIFIGTNAEPLYSEQLSWEGLQDKMSQSLEMCFQDYSYTILDNAYLCHWPGVKKKKIATEEWRADFVEENKKFYEEVISNLLGRYQEIPQCNANKTNVKLVEKSKSS